MKSPNDVQDLALLKYNVVLSYESRNSRNSLKFKNKKNNRDLIKYILTLFTCFR